MKLEAVAIAILALLTISAIQPRCVDGEDGRDCATTFCRCADVSVCCRSGAIALPAEVGVVSRLSLLIRARWASVGEAREGVVRVLLRPPVG